MFSSISQFLKSHTWKQLRFECQKCINQIVRYLPESIIWWLICLNLLCKLYILQPQSKQMTRMPFWASNGYYSSVITHIFISNYQCVQGFQLCMLANSNWEFVCAWIWERIEIIWDKHSWLSRRITALLVIFQLLMWADCWGHLPELNLLPPHRVPLQSRNFYLQNHSLKWKSFPHKLHNKSTAEVCEVVSHFNFKRNRCERHQKRFVLFQPWRCIPRRHFTGTTNNGIVPEGPVLCVFFSLAKKRFN